VHLVFLLGINPAGYGRTPWSIFSRQNLRLLVSFQSAATSEALFSAICVQDPEAGQLTARRNNLDLPQPSLHTNRFRARAFDSGDQEGPREMAGDRSRPLSEVSVVSRGRNGVA
jgi:hypothetical protein